MYGFRLVNECNHLRHERGNLKVLLAYPGKESVGFSSLALHVVYSTLNSIDGISCDLIFEDLKASYFLELHPTEFDVIAFSVTYENHIFKIAELLRTWNIEPLREKRENSPLIVGGGIGLSYNPSPFMPIFDAVYLGEAEGRIEEVFKALRDFKKVEALEKFDNVLLCKDYRFEYDGAKIKKICGSKKKIFRSLLFGKVSGHSCFICENLALKEMFLIELNRGCIEKCRFCVATYMGLPYREKEINIVERELKIASQYINRVGFIGAGVSDYSKLEEIYKLLKKYNLKASFSSLKASSTSPFIFKILKDSEQKTATLAPEAGTDRLRMAINKKVQEEEYIEFAKRCFEAGTKNLKLYFLVGLPTETQEDLESIAELVKKFREVALPFWKKSGFGEIHVSVNPVIAKPFTPLQWYGLNPKGVLEKKLKFLARLLRKIPNVKFSHESVRNAILQAVVSRGDDRVGIAAVKSVQEKTPFRKSLKDLGLNTEEIYTREREKEEVFPWNFIESGINREYLWREYRKIYEGKTTPACFNGCKACGLC